MSALFHFELDSRVTPLSSSKVNNTNLAEFENYQDFHMGKNPRFSGVVIYSLPIQGAYEGKSFVNVIGFQTLNAVIVGRITLYGLISFQGGVCVGVSSLRYF
jgi:hypothetical protein